MEQQFKLEINQETTLHGYIFEPENINPKGIVLICHGMAEHIKRYLNFMDFLSKNDYIAVGYDQRGHGLTAGSVEKCGYMDDQDNFDVLVEDLYKVNQFLQNKYPNLPIYLLGHSMGSFVSQRYIELYSKSIKGVILSGSTFNKGLFIKLGHMLSSIITKFKGRKHISHFINNLSLGSYNKKFKPAKTEVDWLSRDHENNIKYVNDEYCGMIFTVSYFKDLTHGFLTIAKNIELIDNNLPVYIMSGDKDPVGNFGKGTTLLYNKLLKKAGLNDLTLKLYKDGRHEMLNEINKDEVYSNILEWLKSH